MTPSEQPPLEAEQWLSLVLALASHRSSNEAHRDFGTRIVKFVYDELPAQYASDPTAKSYLNNMLAEVSWAVRGFSNVRDHFQRQVSAQAAQVEQDKGRAKGWSELSPLKPESLGGKALSLAVGAGGATALSKAFPNIPVGWNVAAVLVIAYTVHLFIEWLQARAVRAALAREPKAALESWNDDIRPRYEAIMQAFLEKASTVQTRFYPSSGTAPTEPVDFTPLIERALSFGETKK